MRLAAFKMVYKGGRVFRLNAEKAHAGKTEAALFALETFHDPKVLLDVLCVKLERDKLVPLVKVCLVRNGEVSRQLQGVKCQAH